MHNYFFKSKIEDSKSNEIKLSGMHNYFFKSKIEDSKSIEIK